MANTNKANNIKNAAFYAAFFYIELEATKAYNIVSYFINYMEERQ